MINNEAEFRQTLEQLERMYRALADLRQEVMPKNPCMFALMAEGPLDHIRQFQEEIESYVGAAEIEEQETDVWIRLQGNTIQWPETPISILTAFLDALRKGIQTVAEFVAFGDLATRPTADLKRACDLRVVAFRTGSLRIGMRLPSTQPDLASKELLDLSRVTRQALRSYLEVAAWVDSDEGPDILQERFSDEAQLRLLLNALKTFVPRPRGDVESVELTGQFVPQGRRIRLTRAVHSRIDQAIDRTVAAQVEEHEGDLREIDLDEFSFILRNAGDIQQIQCRFEAGLLEAAKEALDRRVKVTGTRSVQSGRRQSGKLHVRRLVVMDQGDGQETSESSADDRDTCEG
jgi:hypothetical protein